MTGNSRPLSRSSLPITSPNLPGQDVNGDIFGNNDRVGIEPRNTFKGDSYQAVDLRVARTFNVTEKMHLQAMAEAFNVMNTLNVRFFNTAYGAADFCNLAADPVAQGCGTGPFFQIGRASCRERV